MENFYNFFDDNNNNENKQSKNYNGYNNDLNITIDNLLYNKEETFPTTDYYFLSNQIILEACKKYNKDYGNISIPFSYISFYFAEISKYVVFQSLYVKKFLLIFHNKQNNIKDATTIFCKMFNEYVKTIQTVKISNNKKIIENCLKISIDLTSKTISCENETDLYEASMCLKSICDKIEQTTIDHNLKYEYIDFLSRYSENKNTIPKIQKNIILAPIKKEKTKKVSNLILPILKLNHIYPISSTKSRIDSAFFAWSFLDSDKTYNLISKYKFTQAKCTDGFVEKRKKLFDSISSNFDLF